MFPIDHHQSLLLLINHRQTIGVKYDFKANKHIVDHLPLPCCRCTLSIANHLAKFDDDLSLLLIVFKNLLSVVDSRQCLIIITHHEPLLALTSKWQ